MTIGIPRGLFYYYYGDMWMYFFDKLGIKYVVSPETNKDIKKLGNMFATDEMCLSLKNYIGHIAYLSDKCDYILIPRIDNYGLMEQTCTNFLGCYDIIRNMFDVNIINYNVSVKDNEYKGFIKIGKFFRKSRKDIRNAYLYAKVKTYKKMKNRNTYNMNKLNSNKKKILLVSHPYNTYDLTIGIPIIRFLESLNCNVIYSDLFDKELCRMKSSNISKNLYWRFSKEIIGSIELCRDKVDGIIFLSTFPCGLDSLVNELVIRKINKKCLNLIIDDMDSFAGVETRLESFVDIV